MPAERATEPIGEELPRILSEKGASLRALAARVGVSPSHLSRVLRPSERQRLKPDLVERITNELGLEPGYFAEQRAAVVIDAVNSDPKLRDRLYDQIAGRRSR